MLSAVEDEKSETYKIHIIDSRELSQLESLLLLLSETDYQTFSLMGESMQKAILSLAYDLSMKVGETTH